ncbi:hypothetical protein [Ktedonobacter sp. SOSP1-52]|uniref:hypothetical protein n=1 Tax=Ktedonobacter sp. SOSP1-52 TaxID=2778366 RepID=UPI001916665A|nr:hypothetical protein [Ktedonobacter sp. SOSP1-52]
MLPEPQHSPKRGYRRRSVLIGGIGAVAALAGGGGGCSSHEQIPSIRIKFLAFRLSKNLDRMMIDHI